VSIFTYTRVNSIKDLGIYFQRDLGFKINHVIVPNKSYNILGFLNRNSKEFRNRCLKNLYTLLVILHSVEVDPRRKSLSPREGEWCSVIGRCRHQSSFNISRQPKVMQHQTLATMTSFRLSSGST